MTGFPEALTAASAAEEASTHLIRRLPILILFPHNRCNCRCMMCDIWKIREVREITERDLEPHLDSLRALEVRWVVFSGGEPLMHSNLPALCRLLRAEGIRVTLLTTGLLLERFAGDVAAHMDDVIVSLDGPPEIHDRIRGVKGAFRRLARGVAALHGYRPIPIRARCTVQRANASHLRGAIRIAHELGLSAISFLAADLHSEAFNRPGGWPQDRQADVALDAREVEELQVEVESLIREFPAEIRAGFVVESPERLRRIVSHFRACLGMAEAVAPRCNAPWISAVIEADGTYRPCFFHSPLGNIREGPLHEVLNNSRAMKFRRLLNVSKNPVCRRCVCSLEVRPGTSD
jgi:Fe-coproporphyrin III synthase